MARPRTRLTTVRHLGEYLVFRTIVCVIQILPFRESVRLTEILGTAVSRLPRKINRFRVADENLVTAFGDEYTPEQRVEIIRRMWIHLFRMIVEMVQFPRKLRLHNADEVVSYRFRDESVRTLCSGRPVILLGGHFGNWEVGMATFGLYGFLFGVVARDLDNPFLHRWFERYRETTGHRLISKRGAAAVMPVYAEHRANLGVMGDQDAGKKGLFVDFFGRPASTFKSIALLAMEYRAVILVGYTVRLPDDFETQRWSRFEMGTEDIIDPDDYTDSNAMREITERYTLALERAIRRHPEQYFWVHRRWKSEPRKRRKPKTEKGLEPSTEVRAA